MKKLLLSLTLFIGLTSQAFATVHFDLAVSIDLNARQITVSGTSSKPTRDPVNNVKSVSFSYQYPLPAAQSPSDWRGGSFASENELYLPSGWHPKTDELMTFKVTLDAILPGAITEEVITDSRYTATFTMANPTEGMPLFAGPYKIAQLQYENTRLRTYFYEDMGDLSEDYLNRTARYIQRFSQQIGPFPFPEFHIIASPIPTGYGFAGATYIGKRVLRLPFIKETSLGHEILHNYWGNGIFPDYASGNWAEGLTTYMADYMTAENASADKARDMRLSWLRDYAALPQDQDKPVVEFVAKHGQASQVIGYNKTAFIFHMLHRDLKDEVFFQGLRHFWQKHAFKVASWKDLQTSFEETSGQDLDYFFHQWVYKSGAPGFKNFSARANHHKGEGWKVTTRVVQDTPVFKGKLPIAIGTGSTLKHKSATLKGRISQSSTWVSQRPLAVSLDPDFHLFRKLGPNEAPPILRDVMLAQDIKLVLASPSLKEVGIALANRLSETGITLQKSGLPTSAFITIGLDKDIETFAQKWRLPPHTLKPMETTAKVWAGQTFDDAPYIMISVQDEAALSALMRPLPHYGKRSALQFMGSKAIEKSTGQTRPIAVPIH
ncbi:M1 family aminopeptidase [Terasakiella sp. A23]|uniref:M1 family metallopeptidase n=1 Tax=Terasakiella sp. FCG-A23 TaxID=3080561 RepID=UPI002953EC5A|nr:M1 family aminopeptidase [Terasakiella sp. A23]MDV7341680.1 M1 family aminopeptidase [Terasakiella sp. A23]